MTDNEIIKALRCCADRGCRFCAEQGKPHCRETVASLAWDLIQRQKEEVEKKDTEIAILIRKNETLKDEVAELRADKEALINGQITLQEKLPGVIKNEAYKEFADALKNCFCVSKEYLDVMTLIDGTLRELTERKEDER